MKNKGITLIALVITIIVLLILTGVSLSLVAGNDGILQKATKAVSENQKASLQEELELKMSELVMEYYSEENSEYATIGEYIKQKIKGYKLANGSKIKYDEGKEQFSFEIGGGEATFKIDENGKIIDLEFPKDSNSGSGSSKPKDTIPPAVRIKETTTNSITFYATDAVGIVAYAKTESNEQPTEWEEIEEIQELEKTMTGLINNKTYYIWVKDGAGNISEPQEAITINFENFTHEETWTGSTAMITVTAPKTGVKYRIGATGEWSDYDTPISVESGTTVQFIITDGTNSTTATSVTPRLKSMVSYDKNGGTGNVPATKECAHEDNVKVDFASKPTREGYTFNGWSTNRSASNAEYTENGENKTFEMPARAVILYAIWIPNSGTVYKVEHRQMNVDGNGYTIVETENLAGTTGASITPTVKAYTGFTQPSTQTTTIAADGSTTVVYDYIRNQYSYTLERADGVSTTGSTETGEYYYDATITLNASVMPGYTWDKWIGSDSSFTKTEAVTTLRMPASSLTMTPKANLQSYTVTYDANGGENAPTNQTKIHGTALTLSTVEPTREGYTFKEWNTNAEGTGRSYPAGESYEVESNVTLYAIWNQVTSLVEQVKPANYGDRVTNYSAGGVTDWRVFYNDGNNVYLITTDLISEKINSAQDIKNLSVASQWTSYIDPSIPNAIAYGAPTESMLLASYNAKNGTSQTSQVEGDLYVIGKIYCLSEKAYSMAGIVNSSKQRQRYAILPTSRSFERKIAAAPPGGWGENGVRYVSSEGEIFTNYYWDHTDTLRAVVCLPTDCEGSLSNGELTIKK